MRNLSHTLMASDLVLWSEVKENEVIVCQEVLITLLQVCCRADSLIDCKCTCPVYIANQNWF